MRGARVSYNGYYVSFPRIRRRIVPVYPHQRYIFSGVFAPVFYSKLMFLKTILEFLKKTG